MIPYIYSVDAEGNEYNFLADYYRTTQELASNIFRKGYQWPFHATRVMDFGSSLLDMAVAQEQQSGVWYLWISIVIQNLCRVTCRSH